MTSLRLSCRLRVPCALLAAAALALTAPEADAAPNVVILLADDLGWADVGYHGGIIATPAIDRLAREGVRLERFYATPICSPTRAALLGGRDPMRLGIAYDQIHPWYNAGLAPDAYLLSDAFRAAGYRTALVGKWHLGHTQAHQLPNAHGFDEFHGHLHTNTDFYRHEREGGHDLQHDGRSTSEPGQYLTHIQAREAVRIIRERDASRPFLLYLAFTAPHSPMQAPQASVEKYRELPARHYRRTYAAMVDEMDRAVAAVLEALDSEGIADDTIVLFFSDNGGFNGFGGDNRPLRGQKGQTFEGGIRVPAVMRWPGRLPAGEVREQVVSVLDVMPTLAAAAGVPLRPPLPLDGRDAWPALRDDTPAPRTRPLFFASEIPVPGLIHLAALDGPWKLVQVVHEQPTSTQLRQMLFRIEDDPQEERDVASEHPEVTERLAAAIEAWRSLHPMAGTRGTLVPHPGWVPPVDWAEAAQPAAQLQPRWKNELPFPRQLLDITARRGVLVDPATREELLEAERRRDAEWGADEPSGPVPAAP
jgi:arylsulfatase A-like enzyme